MPVTMKQIADHLSLSQPTVSFILNNRGKGYSEETRIRVLETARELGYRPNAAARAMRSQRTRMVGAVMFNDRARPIDASHNHSTLLGLNYGLEQRGYALTVVRATDASDRSRSRIFDEHLLDAVCVMGPMSEVIEERLNELVPMVCWADANREPAFGSVRRDEVAAGRDIAQAVLDAGYERVVYVEPPWQKGDLGAHYSEAERREGVSSVLNASSVDWTTSRLNNWRGLTDVPSALALMRPDTALITYDYATALTLLSVAVDHGKASGRDFGLASCDSSSTVTQCFSQLARVEFDRFRLGQAAAEVILSSLEDSKPTASLRVRDVYHPGSTLGRVR